MILLNIINNIKNDLDKINTDQSDLDNNSYNLTNSSHNEIIFKIPNENNFDGNINNINDKNIKNLFEKSKIEQNTITIKCKICGFLGSGSYGKVYKIKINKKYYAFKISENEKPNKLFERYNSLITVEQIKKYTINIFVSGTIKCGKYHYFSLMEFGGKGLKASIPIQSNKIKNILNQLYNISYLCGKHRILMTDFKLNNIVIDSNYQLKMVDLYMECESYTPCKGCRIVKTYSTMEMDRMKNVLEDNNYIHTYQFMSLGIGLIDLLCTKSASNLIHSLGIKYNLTSIDVKKILPLIQASCYNYSHKTNKSLKKNYSEVYKYKIKLEHKYPFITESEFYENFIESIDIKADYKKIMSTQELRIVIDSLFSAYPDERSLEPLKKILSKK